MKTIDMVKCQSKYHISFDDTVYEVRALDTRSKLFCSEKELELVLENISDMSEIDFIAFCAGFSFGDFEVDR